jgi:hypothetical protein
VCAEEETEALECVCKDTHTHFCHHLTRRAATPRVLLHQRRVGLLQFFQRGPSSGDFFLRPLCLGPGSGDLACLHLVQNAKAFRLIPGSSLAPCCLLGCGPGSNSGRLRPGQGCTESLDFIAQLINLAPV